MPVLARQRAHLLGQQADARLHPRALARRQGEREEDVVAARERLPRVRVPGAGSAPGGPCAARASACAAARGSRARPARSRARAENSARSRSACARTVPKAGSPASISGERAARRASRGLVSITRAHFDEQVRALEHAAVADTDATRREVLAHVEHRQLQRAVVGVADRAAGGDRLPDRVQQQVEGLLVQRGERGQPRGLAGSRSSSSSTSARRRSSSSSASSWDSAPSATGATRPAADLAASGAAQVALDGRERRVPPGLAGRDEVGVELRDRRGGAAP